MIAPARRSTWSWMLAACLPVVASTAGDLPPPPALPPDPLTLTAAVDLAVRHNLDLAIERILRDETGQNLIIARSAFDPGLSASADSRFRLSPGSGTQLDGAVQPESRGATSDAALEQPLPTGGSLGISAGVLDRSKTNSSFRTLNPEFNSSLQLELRQPLLKNAGFTYNLAPIRIAEIEVAAGNHELQVSLLDLLADTESAYWAVVAAEAGLAITAKSIALSELIVEETTSRQEAALATETDVLEAKSALASRREVLLQDRSNVESSRDDLFQILGLILETDPASAAFEPLPPPVALSIDPAASYQTALAFAPSLLVAKLLTERRQAEWRQRRNQALPQLDVVASTGMLGKNGTFSGSQRSLREIDGHFWDVSLQFSLPWGNREQRARVELARAALDRSQLEVQNAKIDLYTLIRSACRAIQLSRERHEAAGVTRDFAERKLAQQRERYRQGEVTIRDVVEAQNDLDSADFRLLQTRVSELDAWVDLARLEGTLPQRYGLETITPAPDPAP